MLLQTITLLSLVIPTEDQTWKKKKKNDKKSKNLYNFNEGS